MAVSDHGPSKHSDLGMPLSVRGATAFQAAVNIVFAAAFAVFGSGMTVTGLSGIVQGPAAVNATIGVVVVMVVLGILALWVAYLFFRTALRRYRFFEHGAAITLFGFRQRELRYTDLESLSYGVTRRYINGVYAGTEVDFTLIGRNRKQIRFTGRHKERPDGVLSRTLISKNFKGEDELDAIKNYIAEIIATSWLASGHFREKWVGSAVLTPSGFEFELGHRKGSVIPYARITEFRPDLPYLRVYLSADPKDFLLVQMSGRNFWPGLVLVNLMRGRAVESDPAGATTLSAT